MGLMIDKSTLREALQVWAQAFRDGKTLSHAEADTLSVEEHAELGADYIWDVLLDLHGKEPATMDFHDLTFREFREANRTRCLKWHPQGIESWSNSDWLTAIVGELGELAGFVKMRNRERDGLPGNKFSPTDADIAKEAADVFTYLDLFCERNSIDLGLAAAYKFNEVSERVGFPDRIGVR